MIVNLRVKDKRHCVHVLGCTAVYDTVHPSKDLFAPDAICSLLRVALFLEH